MVVKFYNSSSDPRVVNKYLTDELILDNVQTTDTISLDAPTLKLNLTAEKLNRNYCYIPDYHRYYYLGDAVVINGHHVEIDSKCDVLMSFKNAVLNANIIAERSTSSYDPYMVDPVVSDSGRIEVITRKGAEIFNTATASNNYLIMLGG